MDTSLSSGQAVACPAVRIRQEGGTGSWNQEVRRHTTLRDPLGAQWRMTKLESSDRTRSVSYTALSPCVGGQIKATLIHNREALLNPAGALKGYALSREDVHAKKGKADV